jgi:predicted O-methyltransferase YrrM
LERRGYEVRRVPGFSAIDFGRSVMTCDALRAGFDELLWIDSDIAFDPDDVDKLRSHDLPFVCGVYAKKGCREFACEFAPGTRSVEFGQAGGLTGLRYTGFGFALTRRAVYEAIKEKLNLPECNQRFGPPIVPYFLPLLVPDGPGQWYLAEDYAFCERARQAGVPILADTSIRLWHVGSYAYGWEDAGADKGRFPAYTFHVNRPAPPPAGEYTQDWFTKHIPLWTHLLAPFKGKSVHALEVGVFEGMSTVWLLENILTHPAATLTYVDTFRGGSDHAGMDLSGLEERFLTNTARFRDKLIGLKGRSRDRLRELPQGKFDLAYIDGSHEAADVRADADLAWPLVTRGGLVGFDDYGWRGFADPQRNPGPAIDSFLAASRGRYDVLHKGYQVWLRKVC